MSKDQARDELREAFDQGQLSLFLGAGVSKENHLPNWEELVLAMYFSAVSNEEIVSDDGRRMRPFPNYLYAIAEWQLRQRTEPLEITARKLRMYYDDLEKQQQLAAGEGQKLFRENLYRTLYGSLLDQDSQILGDVQPSSLRQENATLDAVASLCEAAAGRDRGVQSVVTYNYDDLLERVVDPGKVDPQPVDRADIVVDPKRLPIYHVHGLVPLESGQPAGSATHQIVFTEDEYHLAARDAYSWSNLVQLQAMSNHAGLLVGLSVTDRNMRRLLDAVSRAPVRGRTWALLKRENPEDPGPEELRKIHDRAIAKIREFEEGGMKAGIKRDVSEGEVGRWVKSERPRRKSDRTLIGPGEKAERVYERQILQILQGVDAIDFRQEDAALRDLGVTPLWFDAFPEIAEFVRGVAS